jgi:hypothetical protein
METKLVKMKKVLAALLLLVTVLLVLQWDTSSANPYIETPAITITQPSPSFVTCYNNTSIPLSIEVRVLTTDTPNSYNPQIKNISYSIDNKNNITLTNLIESEGKFYAGPDTLGVTLSVRATIENLTEGNHHLKAYSTDIDGEMLSTEIIFTVDSSYTSPALIIISPQNTTYSTSDIPLIFSVNKEYRNAKYVIDDKFDSSESNSITGNITLTNLSNGSHKIWLSAVAQDKYHSGISIGEFVTFTIDNTISEKNELEKNIVIATVLCTLLVSSIYIFYYGRKKK